MALVKLESSEQRNKALTLYKTQLRMEQRPHHKLSTPSLLGEKVKKTFQVIDTKSNILKHRHMYELSEKGFSGTEIKTNN